MLFVRYENWRSYVRSFPVTVFLFAVNVIMFLIVSFSGGASNNETLIKFGALTNMEPFDEWWRYVTSIFLHGGISHLLFNSFALLVFAPPLERLLGAWKYAVVYLISGIVGNLVSVGYYNRMGETLLTIGASGAIYGVYGAFLYIALFQRHWMDESSRKTIYAIIIINVIYSFISLENINWAAHLGGLVSGFFVYGVMAKLVKSLVSRK